MADRNVVVVGAGIAGLSAAVSSAEAGLKVTVVDRATEKDYGGNTRYTEAFMRMSSTREVAHDFEEHFAQNAYGLNIDPSLLQEALRDEDGQSPTYRSAAIADGMLIQAFADEAGNTLAWLEEAGVRFEFLPSPFITTSTTRLAPVGGGLALIEALYSRARRLGVEFRWLTTAIDLVTEDDGAVSGLVVKARDGSRARLAGVVVLACGGFEGNLEMLTRYLGPAAVNTRPVSRGGYFNKGEGVDMALRHGAAPSGEYGLFHAEPVDPRSGRAEAAIFIFPYGILVNQQGVRFVDEAPGPVDANYESIAPHIFAQPGGIAYVLLDAKLRDVPRRELAIRTDQAPVVSDDIAGIARQLELPEDQFTRTVEEYNAACGSGEFDPLNTDGLRTNALYPPKSNWARPLNDPPFSAYPIITSNVFTFGGVKVNTRSQVIDVDGTPISGLYAAGEVIGLYFGTYSGATSVLRGAVFGRLAARDIAISGTLP